MPVGPAPKRSEERRRRNTPAAGDPRVLDVSQLVDDDPDSLPFKIKQELPPPPAYNEAQAPANPGGWHPMVQDMWESFHHSGSALFWEPSDWHVARLFCESLSRDLEEQVVGITPLGDVVKDVIPLKGASLNAYAKIAGMLMLTEGDRRKAGLEIKRDRWGKASVAPVVSMEQRRAELLGESDG